MLYASRKLASNPCCPEFSPYDRNDISDGDGQMHARAYVIAFSPRGTRLRDHTPCSHWQTHTVVVALRLDGLKAPAVFDGPIDNPTFLAYVDQVLALLKEAASRPTRILWTPAPTAVVMGFGESAIELELRFWIADAHKGVQNVKSEALLEIWRLFRAHGIPIPYPKRDLVVRPEERIQEAAPATAAGLRSTQDDHPRDVLPRRAGEPRATRSPRGAR